MGITKTLGKETLGGGKKVTVDLRTYDRSTSNLSYAWRSSMGAATLVPCMAMVAQPMDVFDIDIDAKVMTHPTTGPLFGSFKLQVDIFVCPWRNYVRQLQLNALGIGLKMNKIILPHFQKEGLSGTVLGTATKPEKQISSSCVMAYLGTRGWGTVPTTSGSVTVYKQALKEISYLDIFRVFYANKQEDSYYRIEESLDNIASVEPSLTNGETPTYINGILQPKSAWIITLNKPDPTIDKKLQVWLANGLGFGGTWVDRNTWWKYADTPWIGSDNKKFKFQIKQAWDLRFNAQTVETFSSAGGGLELRKIPLDSIDKMREWLMGPEAETTGINLRHDILNVFKVANNGKLVTTQNQYGLVVKTYQSDIFNCWIDKERIDGENGIAKVTAISTKGDSFTLDTLNLSKKVYEMMTRISVSGGTYSDWVEVNYNTKPQFAPNTPYYVGGMSDEIIFDEVVSTASSEGEPLASLAGKGMTAGNKKGGKVHFKVDEPSYVMGIVSITPRVDYSQGNAWDNDLVTVDDLHKPGLDQIGFQDLLAKHALWSTNQLAPNAVSTLPPQAIGKIPAWLWYQTNVNQTYGLFAEGEDFDFMVLNRKFEVDQSGNINASTYINPNDYYSIFAQNTLEQQPFWVQLGFKVVKRSAMSARTLPQV